MALAAGARIGPFQITALIGKGGMGEVYRATDTNLGRDVAVKVLPEAFAQDPERLARFEREARTLASLNHPNIATIHGLEKADGVRALIMELVEGPTLADRIAQGALPIDDALQIARDIAQALEAAHEQGIVHRDLKPANVKVRPDGTLKVLDFGLAKAMQPVGAGLTTNASLSPTHHEPGDDADGDDSRHGCVHVAGTGEGEGSGQAQRRLGAWRRPLRDAHRPPCVRRRGRKRHARGRTAWRARLECASR